MLSGPRKDFPTETFFFTSGRQGKPPWFAQSIEVLPDGTKTYVLQDAGPEFHSYRTRTLYEGISDDPPAVGSGETPVAGLADTASGVGQAFQPDVRLESLTYSAVVAASPDPAALAAGTFAPSGTVPSGYQQINLVGEVPGVAPHTDPNLNGWGMDYAPNGPFAVVDNGLGVATFYDANGNVLPQVVTIPAPPSQPLGPDPTARGVVYNPTSEFVISEDGRSAPAEFLFCTKSGTISGWNPAVDPDHAIIMVDNSAEGPWEASKNSYDWLGQGVYFWEHAPGRAWQWARENHSGDPAVVAAEISLGKCLDLGDTVFTDLLRQSHEDTVELYRSIGREMPKNEGQDQKLRRLDRLVIDNLVDASRKKGVNYQTVRCPFGMMSHSQLKVASSS
jgi:hypothetical protein